MFGKTQIIIAISKDKLLAAKVNPSKRKIVKTLELGWSPETLALALAKIKKDLSANTVRILFVKDISYVLKIEAPASMSGGELKDYLGQKISEQIPEILGEGYWDYKDLSFSIKSQNIKEDNSKEVIVFSPVKGVFENLSKALANADLKVEAIEPEEVAATRDANPLIGLSMKEDIKGEDEEVLNLKPLENNEEFLDEIPINREESAEVGDAGINKPMELSESTSVKNKPKNVLKSILLVTFLITVSAIAVWFTFKSFTTKKPVLETQEEISPSPQISQIETVPTEEPQLDVDPASYTVQVLNGSGVAGEASFAAELLMNSGFAEAATGNATSSAFTKTEVSFSEGIDDQVYGLVAESLNEYFDVATESGRLTTDEFDIVITVGIRKAD